MRPVKAVDTTIASHLGEGSNLRLIDLRITHERGLVFKAHRLVYHSRERVRV